MFRYLHIKEKLMSKNIKKVVDTSIVSMYNCTET